MQGAVFRGIYQNPWSPLFNCTSNCTWEQEYISLGFDSSCANVTAETLSTRQCITSGDNGMVTCDFTTPGNVSLTTLNVPTTWRSVAIVNGSSLLKNFNDSDGGYPSDLPPGLVRTAIWTNITGNTVSGVNVDSSGFGGSIIECTLSLVAWRSSNVFSISNRFTTGIKEKILLEKGSAVSTVSGYTNVERFWFNQSSLPSLYVLSTNIGALVSFLTSPTIFGQMLEGESMPAYTQGITAALINQNATTIFTKVAESMTSQLQESNTGILAHGLTSKAIVYIRIRWIWMSLPLAVDIAGVALLALTIFSSRRGNGVPLWKSSPAALLFHSVDSEGSMSSYIKGPEELKSRVKSLKVRLE